MPWIKGKDGGGYEKLSIFSLLLFSCGLDICLLRCKEDTEIKGHVDCCNGRKQYKLSLSLIEPEEGGDLSCANMLVNTRRFKIYRADTCKHLVDKVTRGQRLDLVIGVNV